MIAIAGPTGIGKTDLAMTFSQYNLISCDSVMVYKDLNIGSNKEHTDRHLLMDLRHFTQKYDVNMFVNDFIDILDFNRDYLLVGGCGLYMDRAIEAYEMLRECFIKTYTNARKTRSTKCLPKEGVLSTKHVLESRKIKCEHKNLDEKHVCYNDVLSNQDASKEENPLLKSEKDMLVCKIQEKVNKFISNALKESDRCYNKPEALTNKGCIINYAELIDPSLCFYLTCNREDLYRKIDQRCESMVLNGLFDEIICLQEKGLTKDYVIGRSIGYKSGLCYLDNLSSDLEANVESFDHFLNDFKKKSRNYARKQETWFRHKNYCWINTDAFKVQETIRLIVDQSTEEAKNTWNTIHTRSIVTNKDARKTLKTYVSHNKLIGHEETVKIVKDIMARVKRK